MTLSLDFLFPATEGELLLMHTTKTVITLQDVYLNHKSILTLVVMV